jgi:hypothetical protein
MWDGQAASRGEGVAEPRRISQTIIKPLLPTPDESLSQGFRAELPGWDLATLLQMSCARGSRCCVEVRCGEHTGYVFMNEGRLMHASVGTVLGEPAVALMLSWPGGAFALCDRPWPLKPSIDETPDVVLLRLAQARDEAQRHAVRTTPFARPSSSTPPPLPAVALAGKRPSSPGHAPVTPAAPTAGGASAATAFDHASSPGSAPGLVSQEGHVLASVRIDMNGEIVARQGDADMLAPLVGYVTRMGALLGLSLGLEAFEALSADLGKKRALIYAEGEEMVGLLLEPGAVYQELRQQLSV